MKKKKVVIISLLVVILIIAGIIGALYIKTDLFKSDETLFYKYLLKTQLLETEISQRYEKALTNINSLNYSSNGTINCSMAANNSETNVANIQNLFSIKYNMLNNKNLKQNYSDFTISANNKDIATIRSLKDDDTFAIKIDNVVDKYLALENKNLKSFFSKIGVEDVSVIPDSMPQDAVERLLDIDKEQLSTIKETYIKILIDKLTKDNFTKITNSDETKTIELSLTEKEIADIVKTVLETLKKDEDTLNLIIEKAATLGYDWNIDSTKTKLQEEIDKITDGEFSAEPGFLKLALKENGEKTIGIDFSMKVNTAEEGQEKVMTQMSLKVDLSESNKITIYTNDGQGNNLKEEISFGYEDNSILTNIEILQLDENNNVKNSVGKVQYEIKNYETEKVNQNIVITIFSPEDNTKVQFNVNDTTQFKQDVNIEKITDENAVILNNKSSQELSGLITAIVLRMQYLFGSEFANFNINM